MKKNYDVRKEAKGLLRKCTLASLALASTFVGMTTQLQSQTSYSFTAAGLMGPNGPTQTQINTAYLSTNLNGSVTATGGIQTFTVPMTGPYRITAIGAQGGYSGGRAASMAGDFTLTAGTVLKILVGQQGTQGTNAAPYTAGGGGGGSFVTSLTNVPYVIAGGGGGNGDGYDGYPVSGNLSGMEATVNFSANPYPGGANGGTGGNGGTCGSYCAGSGAGIYGNGSVCNAGSAALSYTNGGTGGLGFAYAGTLGNGGFGGGGGHADSGTGMRGGGGGGYSGGGGGVANSGSDKAGGGGGSYNIGVNQLNAITTGTGNGRVTIDLLCYINITSSGSNSFAPSICSGNSVTLTTNAVSNYTWSTLNTTTTSIVVSPTVTTSYSITGTSSINCVSSGVITVIVNSGLPALTITNTPNSICLGKSAVLTAGGALSYTWTGGIINGQTFTPTATSSYTVSGQNGCGISSSVTTLTVAPLPVSVSSTPTLVCQGYPCTLTAVSAVSGYTWLPTLQTGSMAVVAPTTNAVYTVTATDGTCSGVATISVTTKTTPTITAAASTSVICQGQFVVLTATGGLTYNWTPGNLSGNSVTVSPSISTLYSVDGTNGVGCTSSSNQVVLVNPSPTVVISANKTLVCLGDVVNLTASGAQTYVWTNGPNTANFNVNPTSTTVYSVSGLVSGNTCAGTKTISVSVVIPNVTASASPTSVCIGGSATLSAIGASSYTWNGIPGSASQVVAPTTTSIYNLIANTNSGAVNCLTTYSVQVAVNPNPTITVVATKSLICKGNSNTLTASGAVSYSWSNGAITNSIIVSPGTSTLYNITGTDSKGCQGTQQFQANVSTCIGISEISKGNQDISVYPNPSTGDFTIETTGDIVLRLVNSIGQELKVLNLTESNNHQANVKDLANGVYFLVGENAGGKVNQKIVVAK
ncbi:MAG: T9SS type A sorting domain-containing protein [bacterium]|nr:T9SS type A sorting domain-containing protein [bacterium]